MNSTKQRVVGGFFARFVSDFSAIFCIAAIANILMRFYEWGLVLYYHGSGQLNTMYLLGGIVRDLQFSLLIAVFLWLLYHMLRWWGTAPQRWMVAAGTALIACAQFMLITYFAATLIPMGPEFWAYTMREMYNTAMASGWLSISGMVAGIIVLSGAVYGLYKLFVALQRHLKVQIFLAQLILSISVLLAATGWFVQTGSGKSEEFASNKFAYFIDSSMKSAQQSASSDVAYEAERKYPMWHAAADGSVLAPYFEEFEQPPNIVFLIVESLGGEFVGPSGQWTGFAPYLDSLAEKSLYWENGLSLSGRTFGVVPSLLGSLPPARHGFMELGPSYPAHQTLISLLDERGYRTSFFSGYNTYFDELDYFLEYQGVDFILNQQRIERTYANKVDEQNRNYWGYDDKAMFRIASSILDTTQAERRLEVYHTLQSHDPFTVPRPKLYSQQFEQRLSSLNVSRSRASAYRRYQSELTTLLYADEAVESFMRSYKTRPEYENTIFIVTGDHWLVPVPMTTLISRYHVPIIVYSPKLKRPVHFKSVNSHANIVPSLMALLDDKSDLNMSDSVHWIGGPVDTSQTFRNVHSVALMKNKNQLTEYLKGEYYLSSNSLYNLSRGLNLEPTRNQGQKRQLQEQLRDFKAKNRYVVSNNRLYPGDAKRSLADRYPYMVEFDTLFNRIDSLDLGVDQQFEMARQHAFDGKYEAARAIANRLLLGSPDYHDIRLLIGRTYAWEGAYEEARQRFHEVLRRDSSYYDAYNALFDTEYWSGNHRRALEVINDGLTHHPHRQQYLEKKVRVLGAMDQKGEAREVLEELRAHHPKSEQLTELQNFVSE